MSWLNSVLYNRAIGCVRAPGSRVSGALFTHPEFPGLLLRKVVSRHDLRVNCNGFMIFNLSGIPQFGAVGETAQVKYASIGLHGYRAAGRGGIGQGTDASTPVISSDGGRVMYLGLSRTVLSSRMNYQQIKYYGDTPKTIGVSHANDATIFFHPEGSEFYPAAAKAYSTAEVGQLCIMGIVCDADDGVFEMGTLVASNIPDHALKDPIQTGYIYSRMPLGKIKQALAAYEETWLADVPSDGRKYMKEAIDWYKAGSNGDRITNICYATTWGRFGTLEERGNMSGLVYPTAYVIGARDPSNTANDTVVRRRCLHRPTDTDRRLYAPIVVWPVSGTTDAQALVFETYRNRHALASGMEDGQETIVPVETYGDPFQSVMQTFGAMWKIVFDQAKLGIVSETKLNPQGVAYVEKSMLATNYNSLITQSMVDCPYRPQIFIDMQDAAQAIYKKAESLARDDG